MTLSLAAASILGFLAKETAALVLPLALVLEGTLLPRQAAHVRIARHWRRIVLWLPTLAIATYVAWRGMAGLGGFEGRDFGSIERLLTQSRLIWESLYYWFIPTGTMPGLFNLDIELSRGLLSPPSTLPAIIGIVGLALSAIFLRKRLPFYAAGVGFFLVGHALESTVLPLELYFEDRNYLPSALLWLPIAGACLELRYRTWAPPVLMVGIVLILATLTHFRATTWGDPVTLAFTTIGENPDAPRAYRAAAVMLDDANNPLPAWEVLDRGLQRVPNHLPLAMATAVQGCRIGEPRSKTIDTLRNNSQTHRFEGNQYSAFENFVDISTGSVCESLTPTLAQQILTNSLAAIEERPSDRRLQQLYHLRGIANLHSGRGCQALNEFQKSQTVANIHESSAQQAILLARAGLHAEALQHLAQINREKSDSAHAFNPIAKNTSGLVDLIRQRIRDDWEESGRDGIRCALAEERASR